MVDKALLRAFWEKAGIPIIDNDEVGYKRADQFSVEAGLNWSQDWYRILDGKVFVKPEDKDEIAGRSFGSVSEDNEACTKKNKQ